MDECAHPDPPETCARCEAPAVASINDVGACVDHLDEVFEEAAAPLGMLLMAAAEAFGGRTADGTA